MTLRSLLIFSLSVLLLVGGTSESLAKGRKKRKSAMRKSKVVRLRNESPIYEAPNFDSPVKIFFSKGKKVRYFLKRYKGPGGFGIFYKVKIRKGEYGYVVEDDIHLPKNVAEESQESLGEGISGPFGESPFDIDEGPNLGDSIYLSRYVGITYNRINYSEIVLNQRLSAVTNLFGVKLSGPGVLIGAPLDVNIMVLFGGVPRYYKRFVGVARGFLLISDIVFMLPLAEWKESLVYYGVGPLLTYSKYDLRFKGLSSVWDSQEVRMGASFPLGLAIRWDKKFLIKSEFKYYFEKERYFGFQVGFQMAY